MRFEGLRYRVQGSGFRVQGSGFKVWVLGCRVKCLEVGVWGFGGGMWGLGCEHGMAERLAARDQRQAPCEVLHLHTKRRGNALLKRGRKAGATSHPDIGHYPLLLWIANGRADTIILAAVRNPASSESSVKSFNTVNPKNKREYHREKSIDLVGP